MTRHHIRYLPVKEDEALVGIISFHDVAKAVIMQTDMENRLLRRYIESEPQAAAAGHRGAAGSWQPRSRSG